MQSEMRDKCRVVAVSALLKCGYTPSGTFPMSKPYHKEEERRQLMKPNKNIQLQSQATKIWLSNSTIS